MRIERIELSNVGPFIGHQVIDFPVSDATHGAEVHILTGENGTGKSTILQALASAFDCENTRNNFFKKFHFSDDPIDPVEPYSFAWTSLSGNDTVKIFSDGKQLHSYDTTLDNHGYALRVYLGPVTQYQLLQFQGRNPIREPLSFSVHAYSGYRHISDTPTSAIQDFDDINPLAQALSFVKDNKSHFSINQWISNTISKESIARNRDRESAESFTKSRTQLEKALGDILGYKISFDVDLSPWKLWVIVDGVRLDFDVLPDGIKSLLSWIGDLLMVMDLLPWQGNLPVTERNFILLLDEIEVHLHPRLQRQVLPVVQKIFPRAQIFVSTHSPFIVNSVEGAYVYDLEKQPNAGVVCKPAQKTDPSKSISRVLRELFDVPQEFGKPLDELLKQFYEQRDILMEREDPVAKQRILTIAKELNSKDAEITDIVGFELSQLGII